MKLFVCSFLLLAAVAVKIEAVHVSDSFLTGGWLSPPQWPNADVIVLNRNTHKEWKDAWELIKRQLVFNMKKIAEEYGNARRATKDQMIGFLYINREMFRFHWRTISKGMQYYIQKKRPSSPEALKQVSDRYTMMMARALKLERFYDAAMSSMTTPIEDRFIGALQLRIEMWPIPSASVTGNVEMSYPLNT